MIFCFSGKFPFLNFAPNSILEVCFETAPDDMNNKAFLKATILDSLGKFLLCQKWVTWDIFWRKIENIKRLSKSSS